MKKLMAFVLMSILAFSITACAPSKMEKTRVKCPACGYEFDTPAAGGGGE